MEGWLWIFTAAFYLDPPPDLIFWMVPVLVSIATALRASTVVARIVASLIATIAATFIHVAYVIVTVGYSPTGTSLRLGFTFFPYLLVCAVTVLLFSLVRDKLRRRS
jgi:hypothetical protein